MLHQTGQYETPKASQYLQQLCKHFAHKIEVSFSETEGRLALPIGPATLTATDSVLTANVSAEDDAGLERARGIIDNHLVRFAHRENFEAMDWNAATAEAR
ncbi:DUF2218 domain-containing protein [Rhodobacterales bacterium HKCCE4037]|nr:DUF2218 domain-containing protein [Rhodobacterales bacterium HKCCE4037]